MTEADVARALAGCWQLERSEHVQDYLAELGVGACERKYFADDNSFTQTIEVLDGNIHLEMKYGPRHFKLQFQLNKEFEISAGKTSKAMAHWADETLVITAKRVGCGRIQKIERNIHNGSLIQTMTTNGVSCKRVFKRVL